MFSIIQLVGTVEQLYCPYLLILSIKKLVTVLFPIASSINLTHSHPVEMYHF